MKQILLFAISLFLFSPFCFTQIVVWPGDVNNNGIVNEVDLLYLGFAFNATGNPRVDTSTQWTGQEITNGWEGSFPDGLNFAFADCNGDGIVDLDDVEVIKVNSKLTHDDVTFEKDEFLEATPEIDPKFSFSDDIVPATPGVPTEISIGVGNDTQILKDILGVSFTIKVDTTFFEMSSYQFTLNPVTWFIPFEEEGTSLSLENEAEGTIKVAIIKTDQVLATGAGDIGKVSFVIEEDAINFLAPTDTVTLQIDSITVIKGDLTKVPVGGATVIVDIEGRPTSTYNPILDKIKFYPNPNNGWILLQTNEVPVEKVELMNTLGQRVYQKSLTKNNFHSLDLNHIPKGAYWLRMITKHGIKSTPIQKYN